MEITGKKHCKEINVSDDRVNDCDSSVKKWVNRLISYSIFYDLLYKKKNNKNKIKTSKQQQSSELAFEQQKKIYISEYTVSNFFLF